MEDFTCKFMYCSLCRTAKQDGILDIAAVGWGIPGMAYWGMAVCFDCQYRQTAMRSSKPLSTGMFGGKK